jgi:tetratricopeptide (TPR) repeat protein
MADDFVDPVWPLRDEQLAEYLGIGSGRGVAFLGDAHIGGDVIAGNKIVYRAGERRTAPAQLPADVPDFTGRQESLDRLSRLTAQDGSRMAVLTAIHGMAGVGKTALAVHWAHRVAPEFPDGQLYVDLRGYSEDAAMTPSEALGRFLRALGVADPRIPDDEDERAALYRSVLSGRRVLIVLDNAASSQQVRPLLPGSRTCLTLVTSRSQLPALVAATGAATLALDVLDSTESFELITNVLGVDRVTVEPAAAVELAHRCAHLPLALRIAAAHVAMGTYGSIAELCEELAQGDRLAALTFDDDPQLAVRAAFELSYRNLDEPVRRAFRRLGLIEGPDFIPPMLAAVCGVSPTEARRLTRTLSQAHLIEPKPYGRFWLHDLLGEYARGRVREEESAEACDAAVRELVIWYLRSAEEHSSRLFPYRPRRSQQEGKAVPADDYACALAWFEAERTGIVAAARQAVRLRLGAPVWELADAAFDFLRLRRYSLDNVAVQQLALAAARESGEERAQAYALRHLTVIHHELGFYDTAMRCARSAIQACRVAGQDSTHALHMHRQLGYIHEATGEYAKALECFREDLRLSRQLHDQVGAAIALHAIGVAYRSMGQYAAALDTIGHAVETARAAGHRIAETNALYDLAHTYWIIASYRQASDHARCALHVHRDGGDRYGEARTLGLLTLISHSCGEHEDGIGYARQAVERRRSIGDRLGEAEALDTLARLYRLLGDYSRSERHARDALALRRDIGDRQGEAASLDTLARALTCAGDHEQSFDYALQSLRTRREIGDRRGEAIVLNLLSRVAARLDRLAEALEYEDALVVYRDIGDRRGEGIGLHRIARTYRKLGQYAEAIVRARQSLDLRRQIGDRRGEGEALDNISRTYLKMNEPQAALDHAKQALAVEREIGDLFGQGWTLDHLAHIQLALGRTTQALRYGELSLKVRERFHDRDGQRRTLDTLTTIHLALEQPEHALNAAVRALDIARDTARPDELARRLRHIAGLTEGTYGAAAAEPYRQEAADLK